MKASQLTVTTHGMRPQDAGSSNASVVAGEILMLTIYLVMPVGRLSLRDAL